MVANFSSNSGFSRSRSGFTSSARTTTDAPRRERSATRDDDFADPDAGANDATGALAAARRGAFATAARPTAEAVKETDVIGGVVRSDGRGARRGVIGTGEAAARRHVATRTQ
jgi:hypothetical protein|eukprot:30957-Pelagococcus_subviridis.AAC.90